MRCLCDVSFLLRVASFVLKEQGGGGSCAIAYGFKARLHRPGMLNIDAKGKAQLMVLGKPQQTDYSPPVVVGPDTRTVKRCFCLKNGRWVLVRRGKMFFFGVLRRGR